MSDTTKPETQGAAPVETNTEPKLLDPALLASPEFQQAVASATAGLLAQQQTAMLAEFAKVLASQSNGGSTEGALSALALAIADMNDQGSGRKVQRLSPEEAQRRAEAARKCGDAVMALRETKQQARYVVISQTWLDGQMVQPWVPAGDGKWVETKIFWGGYPNGAMRPDNEVAQKIFDLYLESLGGTTVVDGKQDQPVWLTAGGLIMVGDGAPQSLLQNGQVRQPTAATVGLNPNQELVSTDNPNASRIPILGSTFEPATVTTPGAQPNLQFPRN